MQYREFKGKRNVDWMECVFTFESGGFIRGSWVRKFASECVPCGKSPLREPVSKSLPLQCECCPGSVVEKRSHSRAPTVSQTFHPTRKRKRAQVASVRAKADPKVVPQFHCLSASFPTCSPSSIAFFILMVLDSAAQSVFLSEVAC